MNLAINWIKAKQTQILGKSLSEKEEDAIITLLEQCDYEPDNAVKVILEIIEQNPSERVLAFLGAGPVEELLVKYPEYLEKLIEMTPNTSALKECLSHVNYDDEDGLDAEMLNKFLNSTQ
ncbi:DUF6869 domain-containing protein [Methylosarcina fibrata]|uniref:DUF6869 domain-containing protein n=1 Tax=Methylosarcina fibrata TaxID=105972 RepID=UPI0003784E2D|nr:hypothetical protein [Methylosarcina fibrata]